MCAYTVSLGNKPSKSHNRKKMSWSEGWERFRDPTNQNVLAVALAAGFLGFWLPMRYDLGLPGLISRAKGYSAQDPPWRVEADKHDLRLGQQVPSLALYDFDNQKTKLPHKDGLTLLAFTGNCTACTTRDNMVATQKLLTQFPKLHPYIVVMSGDANVARAIWHAQPVTVPLVVDLNGDTAMRMNAIFTFRRYLIDSQNRLIYASQRDEDSEKIAQEIEAAVRNYGKGDGS